MYRDPSEFRKHFLEYKNGKSVREIYGLPEYAGGKIVEQDEPVITQGKAGSRLEKFRRRMDPDEDDGTLTRVLKGVGKGVADIALDLTRASGLETIDRFATHTQRPSDYIDAMFLTAGNIILNKALSKSASMLTKAHIKSFTDMDARELGKYFFLQHPELMTLPQEVWYLELAKKQNSYFKQAISRRANKFLKEARNVEAETIASNINPKIKVAEFGEKNKYGGIYSSADNTMLVNSSRVKDPRTAMRVTGHERTHAMQDAFEEATGYPYPVRYGAEMEGLFPFTAEQRASRPGVHLGKEIDASLHEGKMMRYYDTDKLGKTLDQDFKNMSDEEYKEYINNGYFQDIILNILSNLNAQKKFMSRLKNGKLPKYQDGDIPEDTTIPYEKDGILYNINPNVVGAKQINITTPEVTVTGRDLTKPYRSAYLFNDLTLNEAIRQRMYNTITPVGYELWDSFVDFVSGAKRKTYDPFREALWAKYLGLDYYRNTDGSLGEVNKAIIPSNYKMKVGSPTYGPNIYTFNLDLFKYSPLSNPLHPENMRLINLRMDRDGKNFVLNIEDPNNPGSYDSSASGLGTFVYSRGKDSDGKYMTYYDDWDLNPLEGGIRKLDLPDWIMLYLKGDWLAPLGLGNPFTLADKAYYENGNVPGYKDGKIRIKPSKRGTFTAAAKKHGASVREFESRVLKNPEKYSTAMVKKARFSRNARNWKH